MKSKWHKKYLIIIFITILICLVNINKSNATSKNNISNNNVIEKIKNSILPSGTITYSTIKSTDQDVISKIHLKDGEKILNNNGSDSYTFTENGSFTFQYLNNNDEIKEVTADVNNIDKTKPIIKNVVKTKSSGDLYGEGYDNIHVSTITGRQFKEYKQNIDGWNSKYDISGVNCNWRSECGTVSIITLSSGYSQRATFDDVTKKLRATGGGTQIDGWIKDYTDQYPEWTYNYSREYIADRLSRGEVGILHSTSSLVSSSGTHYMTLIDISADKSKVYLSNPWKGSDYQGWITFTQLSYIFESIGFIEDIGDKPNYCSSELKVDNIQEDKIFYIGDSWMSILQNYEIAQSSNSYFYAKGGANADWVLNTYSSMRIPSDASCIVVEFGLNGLTNWNKTQQLVDKLASDYPDKKIYIVQTPHICSGYTVDPDFNSKVDVYNNNMKKYCEGKERILFINPNTNIVENNGEGYLKDEYAMNPNDTSMGGGKIHLNAKGNRVWYADIINCIDSIIVNDKNITLTINAVDNESGLTNESYSFDGGKTWQSNASKTFSNNVETVLIKVKDNAGNIAGYGNIYRTEKVKLSEIKIKQVPSKVEYIEGQNFIKDGMKIEAVYNTGVTQEITGYTVTNGSNLKVNQTYVTISYTEGEIKKTINQAIKVNKKLLKEIKILQEPNKVEYVEGEKFDGKGLKIEAIYNNGTKKEITEYKINNGDSLKLTQNSVIISYTEDGVTKTIEQKIKVIKKETLKIESSVYEINEEEGVKYIEKVNSNTSIKKFKEEIETNGTIRFFRSNEEIIDEDNLITTGMKIKIIFEEEEKCYTAIVVGDFFGDGKIDYMDLLKLSRFNSKIDLNLKDEYLRATDVYKDGTFGDLKDLLKMSRILVNLESL